MSEKNINTAKEDAVVSEKEEKQSARTFSQEEVNAIVQKRLAEEKSRNMQMLQKLWALIQTARQTRKLLWQEYR